MALAPIRGLRRSLRAILPPILAAVGSVVASAQPAPVGPEFTVNDFPTGSQRFPKIVRTPDGGFVVAWQSYDSPGGDVDEQSVQARRFAADGAPLGEQFQVNGYTTGQQQFIDLAVAADGGFVIVWQSEGSDGGDSSSHSIQARRFAADGTPEGPEFQVNSYTTAYQGFPAVAIEPGGAFVVVWDSGGSAGGDSSGDSVQGRRFDADGVPAGPDFQLNSYTPNHQRFAEIEMLPAGGFVVVWTSFASGGSDASGLSVQARRFDADGDPAQPAE